MENKNTSILRSVLFAFSIVFILWILYWIEVRFGFNLHRYGIKPRTLEGVFGIITSGFLHASLKHLFNNSIPLFLLCLAIFYFYKNEALKVCLIGYLVSNSLVWLFAQKGNHIGASGFIYLVNGFILFRGILTHNVRFMALSLSVIFVYGSLIWYVFPLIDGISWESHLFGFLVGTLFSLFPINAIKKDNYQNLYPWEKPDYDSSNDDFMNHFDENGVFFEFKKEIDEGEDPKKNR